MKKIIISIVVVLAVIVVGFGVWLYTGKFTSAKATVFDKASLPVAMVNSRLISAKDFLQRYNVAKELAKSDDSIKPQEVQGQILDQLVDNEKLEILSDRNNVTVTDQEIEDQYKGVVGQFTGDEESFSQALKETYGLSVEDFKSSVIRPDVLRSNLNIWFNGQESLNQEAYGKRKELLDKLAQGKSFEDVVKEYTQDEATKQFGGDAGFVAESELSPEFRQGLKEVKSGDQLNIVSRYGLHIVKVPEVNREQGEAKYHILQIFVQQDGFEQWYAQETGKISSRKLVKF
jgi:parvulin-like peptidyl-prolyl isomerase